MENVICVNNIVQPTTNSNYIVDVPTLYNVKSIS